jgi:mRNA-degrading endonuclease toxin of MazEF toxin-antitoxin module
VVSAPVYNAGPDVVVAMISIGVRLTSPPPGDVVLRDWQRAGLLRPSVVRVGRLQVIEPRLLSTRRGALAAADLAAVDQALRDVLGLL